MAELDHILWAAPDLDAASDAFAALTGATPVAGGSHPGHGTRNHLVGLAGGLYLEIIAPDPAQDLDGTLGAALAALPGPRLWSAAFRSADLATRQAEAEAGGAVTDGAIFTMSRTRADGVRLEWSILRFRDAAHGTFLPFFIDWQASPHPSASLAADCTLDRLDLVHPHPETVAPIIAGTGVDCARGLVAGGVAHLTTPRGTVVLS